LFLIKRQAADKRGKRDRLYLIFRAPHSAKWRDSLSATRFAIGLLEVASVYPGNTKGGSITVPLTSCLTGLESAVQQLTIFFYLQNRLIQTSQTGGQWYSDTSPFSIPWSIRPKTAATIKVVLNKVGHLSSSPLNKSPLYLP
jgi:hypothetical protein